MSLILLRYVSKSIKIFSRSYIGYGRRGIIANFVVEGHDILRVLFSRNVTELRVYFSEILQNYWSCSGENLQMDRNYRKCFIISGIMGQIFSGFVELWT